MKELFVKGMTYGWNTERGAYQTEDAVYSLQKLKETGSEWIALSFFALQDTYSSTNIHFDYSNTMTDRDIQFAVKEAKNLGLKVCLKPVVNCKDRIWRARIGFPEEAAEKWQAWFSSYTYFIKHYAELAKELECEMFCIGCEMINTEGQTASWRKLIRDVRNIYDGPIIYNANHGKEEGVEWFDAVDIIGTSAYYPVAKEPGDSVNNMVEEWEKIAHKLEKLHQTYNKPILFMEIGCRSALGCATMPWDFEHKELPFSEDEQANFYQSVIQVFWDKPWFAGFFWWDWKAKLYPVEEADKDLDFDIFGKKAEKIVKQWYSIAK
ncbi:glycosyl hydrolase family 53 [Gracilibacillus caseinilyticus]|uniref:Glycosyl hydrolase family 53 n=1 Tax=Gracilibacillus caseinilyticus TaxID=2932256 RepID=A0ABY4EW46_9BACI|nr:glycosyl hydrolase family 53 [Gracilibacillus caseinilyticus]UOQ48448.1 glycosyl hydrolase family 53 [Gracilibacillus caseinilyticus]